MKHRIRTQHTAPFGVRRSRAAFSPETQIPNRPRSRKTPRPSQPFPRIAGRSLFHLAPTSKPRPRLAPTGLFLVVYGCARFTVEWVRLPDANIGYLVGDWLTMGMLLTIPMILAGGIVMLYAYRRARPSGNLAAAKA